MDYLIFYARLFLILIIGLIFELIFRINKDRMGKFIDKTFDFPYLKEGGNYKYKNMYEELSPEGFIINLFIAILVASLTIFTVFEFNLISIAMFLPMLLPASLLFLRIHTFSDKNILPETNIGYNAMFSFMLSAIASIGFYMLFPSLLGGDYPLYYDIIIFVLASAGVIVPMIPDYINKLLPFDIRTLNGQRIIVILVVILVISLWAFAIGYLIFVDNVPVRELRPARYGGI